MISERQVAQSFDAMWTEAVPLLTPSFVHMFNETYRELLVDASGCACNPVKRVRGNNPALVAEIAFQFARLVKASSMTCSNAIGDANLFREAQFKAIDVVSRFDAQPANEVVVTDSEREEATDLTANYWAFFDSFGDQAIEFYPPVKGAGFVDSCFGDMQVGNTLIEVKTVNRNISGRDIRQLLVYFALESANSTSRWTNGLFFNPRSACCYHFFVDDFIRAVAGGRESRDVFDEI